MSARIQIVERKGLCFCAGRKAPDDVEHIAASAGWRPLRIKRYLHPNRALKFFGTLLWLVQSRIWIRRVPRGSCVLFPFPGDYLSGRLGVKLLRDLRRRRGARMVAFVHDFEELRAEVPEAIAWSRGMREAVLAESDVLIVHNPAMAQLVRGWGFAGEVTVLGVFDYLPSDGYLLPPPEPAALLPRVVVAGSFGNFRARYARKLSVLGGIDWRFIGPDGSDLPGWRGCFGTEEILAQVTGDWGLVWDGDDLETCSGTCGRYLAVNNPHKLSLYLAAGIPVIIWEGAALSPFVRERGVGLVIPSLARLAERLKDVPAADYARMRAAAAALGAELRAGGFTRRVLEGLA